MQTTPQYGPPISLAKAERLADAAVAEATNSGWRMVVAIVDSTSQVVLVHRMDDAQHGSVAIAQAKARTAVDTKRPSKASRAPSHEDGAVTAATLLATEA